ncbi:hypothetical protein LTR36_010717 [Oleoguttula mirabilis]|uniref:Glycine zipper domain-containing protein n=1 Tax=Oleoguttula mirabilis TaxID=1507867 RepID=A0AAV9JQU9_9PEZI|nr:hypothetical protein LTR36_010717 [Oleoguttula mirabilis]
MFGKKASSEEHAADDVGSADSKAASISSDKGDAPDEEQKKDGEEQAKEEKPAKPSWWRSALSNLDITSLMNTAQTTMNDPDIKAALAKSGPQGQQPDTEQLLKALAAQQNATGLLQKAQNIKDKAIKCLDPKERQRMIQEAYDKEVEANGQSKFARRLQSGAWQGGAGGAGAGVAVGTGLGTVVGALVGGVASLPTTALGGLIGVGVGGIHGSFVKLDQTKAKAVQAREKAKGKSDKEIEEAVKAEAVEEATEEEIEAARRAADGGEGTEETEATLDVEDLPQTPPETAPEASGAAIVQPEQGSAKRNLQRQQSGATSKPEPASPGAKRDPNKPRKKPRKLEVRSASKPSSGIKAGKENQPSQAA